MEVTYKQTLDELIEGCLREERLAQKRLYERYFTKLMGVSMRYASCHDEAMEILNNGFFKIFTSIEQFNKSGGNFEGWMYRIVVNTALDHLRKEIKHRHTEEEKAVFVEASGDVLSDLQAEEIIALINQLTPAYRAVFNLYVVEGFTHSEIAERLNITEGTSKSNLAKARINLQKLLKQAMKVNPQNVLANGTE
jgi:RNA polymerase sigma-70 factor (ECF subfamily)